MAVSDVVATRPARAFAGELRVVAREHVDQLCALCRGFLRWEREEVLEKEPSPKQKEEHERTIRWLLRAARLLHTLVAEPDFPDPAAKQLLEAVIWQLEESWKAAYEPLPEAEANKLLAEMFPDEPRT